MFSEKVCIITGASSGLGKTLALALAKERAQLVLFARNIEALKGVAQLCQQHGASCLIVSGDVTCSEDCARLVAQCLQHFKRIDYLINNAGLSMWTDFASVTDLAIFNKLVETNYLGAVYCTHYALPALCQTQGVVVTISSLQGKLAVPFHTGYVAAKHALHGFFNTLRIELRESGVAVLIVAPGWLRDTALRANALGVNKDKRLFRSQHSEKGLGLEECCQYILRAMYRRQRELILPKKAKLAIWLQAFCPKLVDWYIARQVYKEI